MYHRSVPGEHFVPYNLFAPWGDIRVSGDDVFLLLSTYPPEAVDDFGYLVDPDIVNTMDHPVLHRYNREIQLQESHGRRVTGDTLAVAEFRGPRSFVASRVPSDIIIDQKDLMFSGGKRSYYPSGTCSCPTET